MPVEVLPVVEPFVRKSRITKQKQTKAFLAILSLLILLGAWACTARPTPVPGPAKQTTAMDPHRWVVSKVQVAMDLPGGKESSVENPSLVELTNGNLLLFAWHGHQQQASSNRIVVSRSTDGGQTWSTPTVPFSDFPEGKLTGAVFGLALKSGRILLVGTIGNPLLMSGSGKRYPTNRRSPYGFPIAEIRDGEYLPDDRFRCVLSDDGGNSWHLGGLIPVMGYYPGGHPMQLSDGRLILPVYGFARREDARGWQFSNGYVISSDQGETWSQPVIVAPGDAEAADMPNEMRIVELKDGRWAAFYRNQFHRIDHNATPIFAFRSYSSDQGKTWSKGQQIFVGFGYPFAGLLPDGALILLGNSQNGVEYAVSHDGGERWDYANIIFGMDARSGGNYGNPSMIVRQNGEVLVTHFAKADRSESYNPYSYGNSHIELVWLKKVTADSLEGRMR